VKPADLTVPFLTFAARLQKDPEKMRERKEKQEERGTETEL
jgi:hypothetical protein